MKTFYKPQSTTQNQGCSRHFTIQNWALLKEVTSLVSWSQTNSELYLHEGCINWERNYTQRNLSKKKKSSEVNYRKVGLWLGFQDNSNLIFKHKLTLFDVDSLLLPMVQLHWAPIIAQLSPWGWSVVTAAPRPATLQHYCPEGIGPFPLVSFQKIPGEFVLAWVTYSFYDQGKGYYGWHCYMFQVKEEAVPQLFMGGGRVLEDRKIDDHHKYLINTTSCTLGFEDQDIWTF